MYVYTIFCLSINELMDIWIVFTLWLLWISLQWGERDHHNSMETWYAAVNILFFPPAPHEILVPWLGIKPRPLAVEAQSPHLTGLPGNSYVPVFCGHMFLFPLDIYLRVQLLGYMVTFGGTSGLFSKVATPFYIPTSIIWEFHFLHIFVNVCY